MKMKGSLQLTQDILNALKQKYPFKKLLMIVLYDCIDALLVYQSALYKNFF